MTIFLPSWSNFEFRYHHDFLNLNFSAILLRIWRNCVVTRFLMSLFLFEIFPLTFETFIIVNPPLPLLSSSSWYPLFSSRNSKNLPLPIFDALSIGIPPKLLFHLCSSYFCHLYELLLRLFRHCFSLKKNFFIVKLINFFYM